MKQGAPGDRPTVAVPTIVFHGDSDTVVHPRNGRFIAARTVSALPPLRKVERRRRVPGGRDYTATTHRGVRMVRVPTTVLAQNDSGVGVKNAINAFGKKNFLGTFAPPFAKPAMPPCPSPLMV